MHEWETAQFTRQVSLLGLVHCQHSRILVNTFHSAEYFTLNSLCTFCMNGLQLSNTQICTLLAKDIPGLGELA